MSGRSIRIFLVDGIASGLRTAELGLSTIKAVVVPRSALPVAAKRAELSRTGVYVLVGPDSEHPGTRKIYVGEGDTIVTRLAAHNRDADKEFWTESIVLVSKDEALTKGHVRFLEARLIKLATEAKRCTVANATAPEDQGRLPEADEVEMTEFIEQARLLLGALGYDVFEPTLSYRDDSTRAGNKDLAEFAFSGDGFSGECAVDMDAAQYVVKQGSHARKNEAESLQPTYKNLRAQLIGNRVMVPSGGEFVFAQDYAFDSGSAAAAVVSGQPVSGRKAWKHKQTGQTLADWEDALLPDEAGESL